jgi:dienelactone hydrolase
MFLTLFVAACAGSGITGSKTIPRIDVKSFDQTERIPVRVWAAETEPAEKAVILLHGCSGWYGGNISLWAEWFRNEGFLALAVDSNSPRNIRRDCQFMAEVSEKARAIDAYSALSHLVSRRNINPGKVVVMGFSRGAASAVQAMQPDLWRANFDSNQPKFAGAVAFYPECLNMPRSLYGPVQVVIGSEDDWTYASHCTHWRTLVEDGAQTLDVHVIDGATHSFDQFTWRGARVGSRTYLGHRLTPSGSATQEAETVVAKFLDRIGLSQ